jgi:hypothetical protein
MKAKNLSKYVLYAAAVIMIGTCIAVKAQDVPRPKLKLVSVTDGSGPAGPTKVYEIAVENHADYDDDLFLAAPVLPPCGKNANASRTWVNIYNELDQRLYGFCGIKTNGELTSLKFIVPVRQKQPKEIFIDIVDRFEGVISRSKNVKVP